MKKKDKWILEHWHDYEWKTPKIANFIWVRRKRRDWKRSGYNNSPYQYKLLQIYNKWITKKHRRAVCKGYYKSILKGILKKIMEKK